MRKVFKSSKENDHTEMDVFVNQEGELDIEITTGKGVGEYHWITLSKSEAKLLAEEINKLIKSM